MSTMIMIIAIMLFFVVGLALCIKVLNFSEGTALLIMGLVMAIILSVIATTTPSAAVL